MRREWSCLLVLMLALLLLASLPAWSQQYSLQTYDRKDGLESLTINTLLQDQRGFVWAGTEMGLYRFDGSGFERMGAVQGFDKGEYVTALAQNAHGGRIWVATQSGLRVGDGLHFENVELQGKPLVADVARQIVALDDESLLLVRDDQLMVLSGGTGVHSWQLRPVLDAAQLARYPSLRRITTVYARDGQLWLGCDTSLCHVDAAGKVAIYGPEQGVPADSWSGLFEDRHGTLWLRGVHHMVALLAGATSFTARDVPAADAGVVNDNSTFVEDPEGRILTATNRGLMRWDGAAWTPIDSSNGLPDIEIKALLFDTQGTLWLGTYGGGIARWSGYGLVEGWGTAQGLDSTQSWSILRSDQGLMWFGDELGGSTLADGQRRLQPWPLQYTPAPRQVLSLAKAVDGAIWAGLYDHRVLRYDPVSHRTTLAAQLPAFVRVLHFDRRGRLWIGTANGLYRIDSAGTPVQRIAGAQTPKQLCTDIAEGDHGELWFACSDGMFRHADGRWTRMQTGDASIPSGFSAVAADTDGSLWLGTNEPGLLHAAVHADQLVIAPVKDGWLDNSLVYFVRRDHRGWIWVGIGSGVDIFDGHHWTHLSRDNGLLWDETAQNSFFEDRDGSVWLGSPVGISHILHPQAMIAHRSQQVIITSVMHGSQPVKQGDSVRIDGNRAPLIVHFSLLGGSSSSRPRFRYRLQGSDWVETTSNVINLTSLPADDYRLEIQAIDDDHHALSPPGYFDFRIPPPWWQAWWIYLLGLLLLALVVAFCLRWYSRQLLRRNRRLESMVAGRTAELTAEKQELELARAELYHQATHDGLTGLYNRKAILDKLAEQLEPAARFKPGLAVGMIDADHFKHINDTYGHQAGDAALLAIARHLKLHVRGGDQLGRYGGEEILMLLPGINRDDAEHRMRAIQASVSAESHRWGTQQFSITLSIGVVWIGQEPASVEDLIRRADVALYQAKSGGRDRVVTEPMTS